MKVSVVGATGLIGRRVTRALADRGDEVVAVSRSGREVPGARPVAWDARDPFPAAAREGVDAVVNLAGEPLLGRWTEAKKRAIRASRTSTTRRIAEAVGEGGPGTLVSGSAVGFYGDRGDEVLDEGSTRGTGFLADVAAEWEGAALEAGARGARVVLIRTGIVLAPDGGALPKMVTPTKLGAGGPLGSGDQWWPWIHVDDEVGIILWALDTPAVTGPVNATAPNPVRQRQFATALARVLGRPACLPTPAFAVRLGLGEAASIVLEGQRALPQAAANGGYRFAHPDVQEALRAALD